MTTSGDSSTAGTKSTNIKMRIAKHSREGHNCGTEVKVYPNNGGGGGGGGRRRNEAVAAQKGRMFWSIFGTIITIFCFLATTWKVDVVPEQGGEDEEQFRHGSNPNNNSNECVPQNIHLSPASSITNASRQDATVNIYVSFTLDYNQCADVVPIIRYGWSPPPPPLDLSSPQSSREEVKEERICPPHNHPDDMEKLQFDTHQTLWTKHSSSWIFHGLLRDIPLAGSNHWYQIYTINDADYVGVALGFTVHHNTTTKIVAKAQTTKENRITRFSSPKMYYRLPPPSGDPTTLVFVGDWGGKTAAIDVMKRIVHESRFRNTIDSVRHQGQIHHQFLRKRSSPKSLSSSSDNNLGVRQDRTLSVNSTLRQSSEDESIQELVSAVVVLGDLSYANGHLPSWETWLSSMRPLFQAIPILVVPGNHELECDAKTFEIFRAYENYFRTPEHHERSPPSIRPVPFGPSRINCINRLVHPTHVAFADYHGGNSYYSYRHGLATIIILNSYVDTGVGSKQYQWLHQKLVFDFDRNLTPWLIVAFHCPFHTTFIGHNNEGHPQVMMDALEPVFVQHGVNLVFSGHNHAYMRTHSVRQVNGTKTVVDTTGKSPIYLTIGTGGDSHSKGPINDAPESWVASRDHTVFGAGKLYLQNATHARWERLLLPDDTIISDRDTYVEDRRDLSWVINHHAM